MHLTLQGNSQVKIVLAISILSLLFVCLPSKTNADEVDVIIRNPVFYDSRHQRYIDDTLAKALEKVGVKVNFLHAKSDPIRERMLQELILGESIHVVAHAPQPGWEDNLLTVRIPIHKGLQGYRLFLINKQDQEKLASIETLEQLQQIPTGAGAHWSITQILTDAGFHVETAEDHDSLFEMLRLRRFITFGRGVFEIYSELEEEKKRNPSLVVEQTLCLFVPLPVYFFVSPKRPELARQIENGLRLMIEDGSFEKHFLTYHQEDIARSRLAQRRVFSIENPQLSDKTPLDDPDLWLISPNYELKNSETNLK